MMFCFLGQNHATVTAPDPAAGNLLAVAASISWALTLIALRHLNRNPESRLERQEPGLGAVVAGNAIACLAALPWALPVPKATIAEWSTIVYLGAVQIALAYVFLTSAMRRLPALEVSLLLLIEPVLNPLWTWIVRDEQPGAWTLAGGAVILGATATRTWYLRSG
jgi:drug/metabolite transporter (DMT)-like permease